MTTRSTPEVELRRAFLLADAAVRTFAPAALDAAGLHEQAAKLRSLPEMRAENAVAGADAYADATEKTIGGLIDWLIDA